MLALFCEPTICYQVLKKSKTSLRYKYYSSAAIISISKGCFQQRWSRGHKARGQAKNTKKFRGQGQTLSRPRTKDTDASVLKKKSRQNFFSGDLKKKVFKNFFQAKEVFKNFFPGDLYLRKPKKRSLQIFRKVYGVFQRNFNGSKIVLSSSRG